MKLTIVILATYAFFLYKGFRKPLYFALAFMWFSFLYPQAFSSPSLFILPFTMISGVLALLGYFIADRRGLPRVDACLSPNRSVLCVGNAHDGLGTISRGGLAEMGLGL